MSVVRFWLLPCYRSDLKDNKAEVFATSKAAARTCRHCWEIGEGRCEHGIKVRHVFHARAVVEEKLDAGDRPATGEKGNGEA